MIEPGWCLFDLYGHYILIFSLSFELIEDVVEAQEDWSSPILEETIQWSLLLVQDWLGNVALQDLNLRNVGVFFLTILLEVMHTQLWIDEEPAVTPSWQSQSNSSRVDEVLSLHLVDWLTASF